MTDYRKRLSDLERQGMLRSFMVLSDRRAGGLSRNGRRLINLSSNDYLGLAGNESFLEEFYRLMPRIAKNDSYGLGVASSRLLTGDNPIAHQLEGHLAGLYGSDACLLFNSGYHANIGILPALFGKDDLILSDKLNHASIHDGLRISRADCKRFNHADYDHLQQLLEKFRGEYRNVVIVTESVFSMDGDCADLQRLVSLKSKYDCQLYLDEAHGVGLYGENGLGLAEEHGLLAHIDFLVGTFGKACGSIGAYLICPDDVYDYLVNHSRSLIFTTALPPVVLSWNYHVMQHIPAMAPERQYLKLISDKMRSGLKSEGLETRGASNIVPVIIGDAEITVQGAKYLQEQGFLIMPVRPPTVPKGSSRFRLSLTADLQWSKIEDLPRIISDWLMKGAA